MTRKEALEIVLGLAEENAWEPDGEDDELDSLAEAQQEALDIVATMLYEEKS